MKIKKTIIFALLFFVVAGCKQKEEKKIIVPSITGMAVDEVKTKYPNLKLYVLSYDSSVVYGRDTILSQSPEPGAQINTKEMVNICVSAGVIPSAQLVRFDGRIDSVGLKADGIQFNVTGWVYNPNTYVVKLNHFYYYACDLTGQKYGYKAFDIDIWLQPKQKIKKSYNYFLSYDKIQIPLDRIVLKVVAGCTYDTHEGQKRTLKVIGQREIVRSLIPKK